MEFKYINTGSDQYSYDANGRMTSDLKVKYNFEVPDKFFVEHRDNFYYNK